jgi:hypothetical protein
VLLSSTEVVASRANRKVTALVFVQDSAKDRWGVEMRPKKLVINITLEDGDIPTHVIQSSIRGYHRTRSHVSYQSIIFNLSHSSQHSNLLMHSTCGGRTGMYPFAERLEGWVCDPDASRVMIGFDIFV